MKFWKLRTVFVNLCKEFTVSTQDLARFVFNNWAAKFQLPLNQEIPFFCVKPLGPNPVQMTLFSYQEYTELLLMELGQPHLF